MAPGQPIDGPPGGARRRRGGPGGGERGSTHARGRAAEQAAVTWLEGQGYRILERNVVNPCGEIDLVARDRGGVLCFVEVKARASAAYGPAIAAVGPAKRRRLSRAAALHVATRGLYLAACRFDVLGLDWTGSEWRYTLVTDAFPYSP
jgi:putative endonuclease